MAPVPVLSQLGHDTGRDEINCGPTCLAMAGYAWGIIPQGAPVKASIMAAARFAQTGAGGTSSYGMGAGAQQMGLDFEQRSFVDAANVRDLLSTGAHVIARGNSYDLPWANEYASTVHTAETNEGDEDNPMSGHVVYITGENDRGEFIVHDPYLTDGKPRTLSEDELNTFGAPHDWRDRPFLMGVARAQFGTAVQHFGRARKPAGWRDPR